MTQEELAEFYDAHIEKIYRFFFYKVANRVIAEDLTSQTFLQFVKALKKQEFENTKAYLYGIAKFVLLDYLRQKYKRVEIPLDDEIDYSVEMGVQHLDVFTLLEKLLPQLPKKQQEILTLRFIEKNSVSETAKRIGRDVNYVSTTQNRAFHSLRKLLDCTDVSTNITEEQTDETET